MKTIAILVALACSSCTLTVTPDGSRTWTMNGVEAARALQTITATK